jgi:hypothetical protein
MSADDKITSTELDLATLDSNSWHICRTESQGGAGIGTNQMFPRLPISENAP